MDLKEIMAIAGKPGLFKMVAQAKNGIIVESIVDQKRTQAFTHDKISSLEEISIFTETEDKPLKEVLKCFFEKLEGKEAPDFKNDNNKLKAFFTEMLPDYDKERVYTSHMQKVVSWYNLLIQHNLLDFSQIEEQADEVPGDEAKPE
ncbi:MAG: DUF5606 domain-containing protein [Bacteroidales bacterium]|nr:DUF5606 domain-containing protein [Bacteroidales bacterium]